MEAGQKRDRPIRVARRVYVGNLAWKTGWQELKDYFGQVGTGTSVAFTFEERWQAWIAVSRRSQFPAFPETATFML